MYHSEMAVSDTAITGVSSILPGEMVVKAVKTVSTEYRDELVLRGYQYSTIQRIGIVLVILVLTVMTKFNVYMAGRNMLTVRS